MQRCQPMLRDSWLLTVASASRRFPHRFLSVRQRQRYLTAASCRDWPAGLVSLAKPRQKYPPFNKQNGWQCLTPWIQCFMLLLTKQYEFKMTIHSIESIKLADQILQIWILNRSLIFELSDSVSIGRVKWKDCPQLDRKVDNGNPADVWNSRNGGNKCRMIPGMREAVLRDYCGNVALFGFCAKPGSHKI